MTHECRAVWATTEVTEEGFDAYCEDPDCIELVPVPWVPEPHEARSFALAQAQWSDLYTQPLEARSE